MKFLVDAQLPPGLCDGLHAYGHQAVHVTTLGLGIASDVAIAVQAETNGMVLVTKDEDFLALRLPDRFGLLWLRCGNTTNAGLRAWLTPRWQQVEALLAAGERMIELR
jgi:predicted nuclease of predicted toxin-antitoxin system